MSPSLLFLSNNIEFYILVDSAIIVRIALQKNKDQKKCTSLIEYLISMNEFGFDMKVVLRL